MRLSHFQPNASKVGEIYEHHVQTCPWILVYCSSLLEPFPRQLAADAGGIIAESRRLRQGPFATPTPTSLRWNEIGEWGKWKRGKVGKREKGKWEPKWGNERGEEFLARSRLLPQRRQQAAWARLQQAGAVHESAIHRPLPIGLRRDRAANEAPRLRPAPTVAGRLRIRGVRAGAAWPRDRGERAPRECAGRGRARSR